MDDLKISSEVSPAISTRLSPEDPQYHDIVQTLFRKNEVLSQDRLLFENRDQHKNVLLTNVSHQLRATLASIVGYGSVLDEEILGDLNHAQRECIERILDGSRTMLRITEDLLVLSHVEGECFVLCPEPIDVPLLVQGVLKAVQPCLAMRRHQVEVNLNLPLPPLVADAGRIRQVLVNLLDNAASYTPEGGHLGLHCRASQESLVVEVSDDGVGIAEEHLPKVFDRYFQVRDQHVNRKGGAGLGLSIVKDLVEMHGGSVAIESALGRGTTVRVTLPLTPA